MSPRLIFALDCPGNSICLTGSDTSEWTKTYSDALGRSYKTVYAAASGTPYTQSFYNNKGQLWKQVDPDGIVALYKYNAKGEQEYSIVALSATALGLTDYSQLESQLSTLLSGTDRITRIVSSVGQASCLPTVNVRRSETYVWTTDGANTSLGIGTNEVSVDGLRSWNITFAGVSSACTTNAPGGNRYVTNTAPDGSYTVSAYSNGRLASVTRRDSVGNQLSAISYSYDAHGRQSTATDARSGATTYAYNNADMVTSVTTPNPGTPGGTPQTTTTLYDASLRAWKTTQPDGTSVENEFFLTGLLKKTWGSRTYPVEYTYDPQGRMKTMKTWQNFGAGTGAAVTTWNYDAYRGWLTKKVYDGETDNTDDYTYKPSGRLLTRVWERGITTTYTYNNAGDLSAIDYSDTTPDVTQTYDRRGRQKTAASSTMTTTLVYNDASELIGESYSGGVLNGLTVTNRYDTYLRRTNLALLSGAVIVNLAGTLGGNGIIGGPATINGTLSPGTSIGTLAFNGSLTLNPDSAAFIEINRTTATNDFVRVLGTLNCGGALSVANLGGAPTLGDNFKIFDAASFSGSFADLELPPLDAGLAWDTSSLTTEGMIEVISVAPPTIGRIATDGTGAIISASGATNGTYYVLGSTNLSLPLSNWTRLATNTFDGSGNASVTNGVNPNAPQTFYRLQLP